MILTKRKVERVYRQCGLSRRDAKAVVAVGYYKGLGIEPPPEKAPPERTKDQRVADLLARAEILGAR